MKLHMSSTYIETGAVLHENVCVHSVYVRLLKELIPSGNCFISQLVKHTLRGHTNNALCSTACITFSVCQLLISIFSRENEQGMKLEMIRRSEHEKVLPGSVYTLNQVDWGINSFIKELLSLSAYLWDK